MKLFDPSPKINFAELDGAGYLVTRTTARRGARPRDVLAYNAILKAFHANPPSADQVRALVVIEARRPQGARPLVILRLLQRLDQIERERITATLANHGIRI